MRRTSFLKLLLLLSAWCSFAPVTVFSQNQPPAWNRLKEGFLTPPDSVRLAVYWYWINNNISKEGVVKDLEAMKKVGINRAFIGNQATGKFPYGDVKLFSEEWLDITRQAMKTAGDLDIEIGMFNCPGWSQSGGPWITPEQSMKYLEFEEDSFNSDGRLIRMFIPDAEPDRIVSALAYPRINGKSQSWRIPGEENGGPLQVELKPDSPFTARTLTLQCDGAIRTPVRLVNDDGQELASFVYDRHNIGLNTGFKPFAPWVETLPEIHSRYYTLFIEKPPKEDLVITLSEIPAVERYVDKSLAKVFQDPLPMWDYYMWDTPPESNDRRFYVNPSQVVNLTPLLDNGRFLWLPPAGEWTVLTTYMKSTGVTNSPAVKEGTGLEVDKINKRYISDHFDAFIGDLIRKIPPEDRKTWKVVVEDSYETGSQNWTDDMAAVFEKTYGYSPLPWLPTLRGTVVGSVDQSDRFLWDLRRLIADRVAYDYVGGLREECHKYGMESWLENYGHWGFPGEFLLYGSQSDQIAGEFWSEGSLGDIENRAASSCGHIYGKDRVWAESCTAGSPQFNRYPRLMKQRVDRFFCEGINASLLHLYIQQPDDRKPGLDAWFGNEFNRNNAWFDGSRPFMDYLKRCNLLLQQGRYVADAAYFIGEDAPKMTGVCDPPLPEGYSFDYINADVLKNHARVDDGRLVLDSGMEYSVLVLPRQETMRPEMLERIHDFVSQGLTIVGPAPLRSPSLQDYGNADLRVKDLAAKMWNGSGRYGAGRVYPDGTTMEAVFSDLGITPDFRYEGDAKLLFIHRTLWSKGELFFVSNQEDKPAEVSAWFRVDPSLGAEIWNPVTGETRGLEKDPSGHMKLQLDRLESAFIVFRRLADEPFVSTKTKRISMNKASWKVEFEASAGNPAFSKTFSKLHDWTSDTDPAVRYYSGSALYTNTFTLGNKDLKGRQITLDLGEAMVIASVKVNGHDAGGAWTYPYRLDISPWVKKGRNTLEIRVWNNWRNRLIADENLPEGQRGTWTNIQPWKADDSLQSSGLLGPVEIQITF